MTDGKQPEVDGGIVELVNIFGTGEGCYACDGAGPFASDAAALEHMESHTQQELAWALLRTAATVQRFLGAVDEPGGIRYERQADELIMEVCDAADRSPARPLFD